MAILKFKMATTIIKCSNIINLVLIDFLDLKYIGIDIRILTVRVSEAKLLYVKIGLNGGHFEIQDGYHSQMLQHYYPCSYRIP